MTDLDYGQINNMLSYKQNQAKNNQEAVLIALDELDKPVSSNEIKQYIHRKALEKAKSEALHDYQDGKITSKEAKRLSAKPRTSMDLRTIQRILATLVSRGVIICKYYRYSISAKGKREMQFRNFAKGYGNIALNNMMNCCFPTVHSLETNLVRLVEIFGVYIVFCFIEASRLITSNKNDEENHWHSSFFGAPNNFDKEGKFRERNLVSSWIKDVFSPWHMLNLFLTAISNEKSAINNIENEAYDDDSILKEYSNFYEIDDITHVSNSMIGECLPTTENNERMNNKSPPPSVMDLVINRAVSTIASHFPEYSYLGESAKSLQKDKKFYNYSKIRTSYNDNMLLYEIDDKKKELLKEILQKRYPLFYKCLQSTQDLFYSQNTS